MSEVVWHNGRVLSRQESLISAYDHGFLYGDSIYETIRTSGGVPFLLDRHLRRLRRSAAAIQMVLDRDDAEYRDAIKETLQAAANPESAIRIVVTRGIGDIGYGIHLCPERQTLIYVRPLRRLRDPRFRRGLHLAILDIRRNDKRAVSPTIKSGNLLNNILGAFEAEKRGADEGILLNQEGYVAEGTMTNVFLVAQGVIRTPPAAVGILEGITRGFVLEVARENHMPVEESAFRPDDLLQADEIFVTSTTKGILPVLSINGQPVGQNAPGPVTLKLTALFDKAEDDLVHLATPG
ncbi:MAG: aminotransferase class IV [Acidobacteriota bacterium]